MNACLKGEMRPRSLLVLLVLVSCHNVLGTLSGELLEDATWGPEGSPYTVVAPGFFVMESVILTIRNATVICESQTCLSIRGKLIMKDSFIGKKTSSRYTNRQSTTAFTHNDANIASSIELQNVTIRSVSAAVSLPCCWGGQKTVIRNSVIDDVGVGLSGYTAELKNTIIEKTTIMYSDMGARGADRTFINVLFYRNRVGSDSGRTSFRGCRFMENDIGLDDLHADGSLQNALFQENKVAIQNYQGGGLDQVTLYKNDIAIKIVGGCCSMTGLNFISNTVNIEYTATLSSSIVGAYWGKCANVSSIQGSIKRSVGGGTVIASSFLNTPHCHETFPCINVSGCCGSTINQTSCSTNNGSISAQVSPETRRGPTTISGELLEDATWGPEGSPYTVVAPGFFVMESVILTIRNATVICESQTCLSIRGKLIMKDSFIGKKTSSRYTNRQSTTAFTHNDANIASSIELQNVTIRSVSAAVSLPCCWGGQKTVIRNSVIDDVGVGLSGYTAELKNTIIEKTTIMYSDMGARGADRTFINVLFYRNRVGSDSGRTSFRGCRFMENDIGLDDLHADGSLQNALFQENKVAIQNYQGGGLDQVTLYKNDIAIKIVGGCCSMTGLNFISNTVNIEYTATLSSSIVGAYWGKCANVSSIQGSIKRSVGGGTVIASSFLNTPHCHETFPCINVSGCCGSTINQTSCSTNNGSISAQVSPETRRGPTTISGELLEDATWGPEGSPYTVVAPGFFVMESVILTIRNATVICESQTCLSIRGKLIMKDSFIGKKTSSRYTNRQSTTAFTHNDANIASSIELQNVTIRSVSAAVSLPCCWGGQKTVIRNSVIDDVGVGLSGYTAELKNTIIEKTTIMYSDMGARGADRTFINVLFYRNRVGSDSGRTSFRGCRFMENDIGLDDLHADGSLQNALFQENKVAIQNYQGGGLDQVTLYKNDIAIKIVGGCCSMTGLNFISNTVNIEYTATLSSSIVGAYWGKCANVSCIQGSIKRTSGSGTVIASSFVNTPHCHETFPCINVSGCCVSTVYTSSQNTSIQTSNSTTTSIGPLSSLDTTACAAGKYKSEADKGVCTNCPTNSTSPAGSTNLTNCTCNAGFSGPNGGTCTACVAGKYKVSTGSAVCTDGSADPLAKILSLNPAYLIASAENWDSSQNRFMDPSGNGRVGTLRAGAVTVGSVTGNGATWPIPYVGGTTGTQISWGAASIPSTFTICSIARYSGAAKARILQCRDSNWLHGHHDNNAGGTYYGISIGNNPGTLNTNYVSPNTNWVVACGRNIQTTGSAGTIINGVVTSVAAGGYGNCELTINKESAASAEPSDWQLSKVYVWNTHLPDAVFADASARLNSYLGGATTPVSTTSTPLPVPSTTPIPSTTPMVWGNASFAQCRLQYSLQQLLERESAGLMPQHRTGGLGLKIQIDLFEVWVCVDQHQCAPMDGWFCWVIDESIALPKERAPEQYVAWGPNSLLKLFRAGP